jgi:hypothetical protein
MIKAEKYIASQVMMFLSEDDRSGLEAYITTEAEKQGLVVSENTSVMDAVQDAVVECLASRADTKNLLVAVLGALNLKAEDTTPAKEASPTSSTLYGTI